MESEEKFIKRLEKEIKADKQLLSFYTVKNRCFYI